MKKNKFKRSVDIKARQDNKLRDAFMAGAKANATCSVESFKMIKETTNTNVFTIDQIIQYLELTQTHLEKNAKHAQFRKN